MHKKKGMEKIFIINKFLKQIKSKSSQVKQSNSQSPQVVKGKKRGNEEIQKYIVFFYILLTSLPSA